MRAAAGGRFEPAGKRLHIRPYNVSADTGAFEACRSRPEAPDLSTLQSVEVRPARGSTCTHSPYHAYPCVHFWGGGVLVPALPCPSRPVHPPWLRMHYAATGLLEHARMTLHAYECARELKTRAQPDSFAVTGVHVCTCTYREHAACIRRYFACANDSAGVRMRNRTHSA